MFLEDSFGDVEDWKYKWYGDLIGVSIEVGWSLEYIDCLLLFVGVMYV